MAFKLYDDFTGEEIDEDSDYFFITVGLFKKDGDEYKPEQTFYFSADIREVFLTNLKNFFDNPLTPIT